MTTRNYTLVPSTTSFRSLGQPAHLAALPAPSARRGEPRRAGAPGTPFGRRAVDRSRARPGRDDGEPPGADGAVLGGASAGHRRARPRPVRAAALRRQIGRAHV